MAINYYKILNVSKYASLVEIRSAFRKLALDNHPDKNPNPTAHETFIKLNEAYQILSNPQKRKQYDYLTDPSNQNPAPTNSEKLRQWQQNMKQEAEKGRQNAAIYSNDFDLFSKKFLKKVALDIFLGVIGLFFGEIYGLVGALVMGIGGIILIFKYWNSGFVFFGIFLLVLSVLLFRSHYKDISNNQG